MAGIYIHIPFCRQLCHYCDFHFSLNLTVRETMIDAICKEISMRHAELSGPIETIYFGGGTPSVLNEAELTSILLEIKKYFDLSDVKEITLEANPEDLTPEYLNMLLKAGINRLSIGVQSTQDHHLEVLHRPHNAEKALNSVRMAAAAGFKNISIDLIYGIPGLTFSEWEETLDKATTLPIQHISAYHLTIEEKTVFGRKAVKGLMKETDETNSVEQFELLMKTLSGKGYRHYEISNFALPQFESKHNSSYWEEIPYLGLGPGAHSYDSTTRSFNVEGNTKYIQSIFAGILPLKREILSPYEKLEEYILISLRTSRGLSVEKLWTNFQFKSEKFNNQIDNFEKEGYLCRNNGNIILTDKGKILADFITLKLLP